jgi:phosphate/sulfate permease
LISDSFYLSRVCSTLIGFLYAFGIGANDVANAFGTTVASKSLTLRQAICVAAVFEFAGALLLGGSVAHTVRSDIFDTSLYADEPDIVMLGFFTSLVSASISLLVASYYGIPVSSTHTVSQKHLMLKDLFIWLVSHDFDLILCL